MLVVLKAGNIKHLFFLPYNSTSCGVSKLFLLNTEVLRFCTVFEKNRGFSNRKTLVKKVTARKEKKTNKF